MARRWAGTKRRWARWSPEPAAVPQDMPTTDPDFRRPPDAHAVEAGRDRTGWPWVTGTPSPSSSPEAVHTNGDEHTNGDDHREDWVPPRRRQFWGTRAGEAQTEQNGTVATTEPDASPAELPAVTDEPEHHTGIVEALSELDTVDLGKPKRRRFRRDKMAPRPADYETVSPPVEEPAPQPTVAEAAVAPAVAEADAVAAVAEVPVESAAPPAAADDAAAEEPRVPRRSWFGRKAQVEAEEASWDAQRPKWPWITQTNGAATAVDETPTAPEPEQVVAEAKTSPVAEEPPAAVSAEEPPAPEVAEPAMPVLVPERAADAPAAPDEPAATENTAATENAVATENAAATEEAAQEPPATEASQPVAVAEEEETPQRRAMWRRERPSIGAEDAGAAAMAPPDWKADPEPDGRAKDAEVGAEEDETPRRRALWRRQAAMVPAEDAGGGAIPPMFAEHEEEEEPERSRWGWLGTKRVAVVILLLLAAEVGYVVHLNTESSSNKSAAPPVTLAVPPSTTAPSVQAPTPTTAPAAAPTATPTTAPKPAPAAAPVVAAKSAPIAPCTTSDLSVVTTTSGNSVGSPVRVTTTITAVHSCIFQPAAVQPGDCSSWIVVDQAGGSQVFPSSTQTESCNPPTGQTMNPGSSESVSVTWTPPAGSAGTYQAVGIWGWASQSGSPNQISMPSQPFSVS